MIELSRLCVFCGSNPGSRPAYEAAAVDLGRLLSAEGIGLVYGGGRVGLMGRLADAVLDSGGQVTGVIPEHLRGREIDHPGVGDLRVVDSMHERKALMFELADGFVALPGGLGTLEEVAEILTWLQLGLHTKPVGLLQVGGFWDPLLVWLDHAVAEGFVRSEHRALLTDDTDPARLLERLRLFEPPQTEKWLDLDET